jgi:hypothetical protein
MFLRLRNVSIGKKSAYLDVVRPFAPCVYTHAGAVRTPAEVLKTRSQVSNSSTGSMFKDTKEAMQEVRLPRARVQLQHDPV